MRTVDAFSAASTALTFVAFVPYLRSVARREAVPHVFSWVLWGTTTALVAAAQLRGGAGVGVLPTAVSAAITFVVAAVGYVRRADLGIRPLDVAFFVLALLSLPAWFVTRDETTAVLVLTTVDLLGFGPTVRKAYSRPDEEDVGFYAWMALRNGLSLLALETFTTATVAFPAAVGLACAAFVPYVLLRRRVMKSETNHQVG